jgi:hypothetical protein
MKAETAMIVWEPKVADDPQEPGRMSRYASDRPPEVRVFDNDDDEAHDRFDRLPCSLGACLMGWCEGDPLADVFRVFLSVVGDGVPIEDVHRVFLSVVGDGVPIEDVHRVFLSVVGDGVPIEDVHREFLKIDEYAAMIGGREFFGVEILENEEA